MAHKKAAGSAKNLRDSNPKYRGLKLAGGQAAIAGNVIIRQKGDVYQAGRGVYKSKDFTLHAAIDGVVSFAKKNFKRYDGRKYLKTVVEVLPHVAEKPAPTSSKKPVKANPSIEKTSTKHASTTSGDDLTKIEGIGPKTQEVLYAKGILTYADLSVTKVGDLRDILAEHGLGQYDPKTWKKQATLAKNGKWDDLKALQDELDGGK